MNDTVALTEPAGNDHGAGPAGEAAPVDHAEFPLSPGQRRIWFQDELDGRGYALSDYVAYRVTGPLDVVALRYAVDQLVRRHEPLRTTYAVGPSGELVQRVHPTGALPVEVVVDDDPATHVPTVLDRPFDLARGPLARVVLYRLDADTHLLLLVVHLLVADAWTIEVLCHDLGAYYTEAVTGRAATLPELPVQYVDWVMWQRERLTGPRRAELLRWWRGQLRDMPPLIGLPVRPAGSPSVPRRLIAALPSELREQIAELARRERSTVFTVLAAVYGVLLGVHAGQRWFPLATVAVNRDEPQTQHLAGFFVDTVTLRIDLAGQPSFRALFDRVRHATVQAYHHRDLPLEDLVTALDIPRSPDRTPLVQVGFVHRPAGTLGRPPLAGCTVREVHVGADRAKFELTFRVNEYEHETLVCAEFDGRLYTDELITTMLADYLALLRVAVADPDAAIPPILDREPVTRTVVPRPVRPVTPTERIITDAVCRVLGLAAVDRDQNFFRAGGDSAMLLGLVFLLRRRLDRDIPLRLLYEDPTVAGIAARLDRARAAPD